MTRRVDSLEQTTTTITCLYVKLRNNFNRFPGLPVPSFCLQCPDGAHSELLSESQSNPVPVVDDIIFRRQRLSESVAAVPMINYNEEPRVLLLFIFVFFCRSLVLYSN